MLRAFNTLRKLPANLHPNKTTTNTRTLHSSPPTRVKRAQNVAVGYGVALPAKRYACVRDNVHTINDVNRHHIQEALTHIQPTPTVFDNMCSPNGFVLFMPPVKVEGTGLVANSDILGPFNNARELTHLKLSHLFSKKQKQEGLVQMKEFMSKVGIDLNKPAEEYLGAAKDGTALGCFYGHWLAKQSLANKRLQEMFGYYVVGLD